MGKDKESETRQLIEKLKVNSFFKPYCTNFFYFYNGDYANRVQDEYGKFLNELIDKYFNEK